MKIAIIHDIYLHQGGAERVLKTFIKMYPQADIYISLIDNKYKKEIRTISSGNLFSSPLNYLPFRKKYSSLLKPLIFLYWESLNLSKYNLVISSSHSFSAKSVKTYPPTCHISYIHTPPRYLYHQFNEVGWIKKKPWKNILKPVFNQLKQKDLLSAKNPSIIVANSETVRKRIKSYYNRDSVVIHPPIKIPDPPLVDRERNYYLFHARLSKQKGCELAIKVFNLLKKKLIVVGTGSEESHLKKIAGPTISFQGFVPDEQMKDIYKQTIALIATYQDEDFGLTPLEAMSYGIPVIGFKSGGLQETINKKNGILFNQYSMHSLTTAIKKFESMKFSPMDCYEHAKQFSEKNFISKMKKAINQLLNEKQDL